MRERERAKDAVQVAPVGPNGTTKAPAGDGPVVVGGVVEWGANGDLVTIGGAKPVPEN